MRKIIDSNFLNAPELAVYLSRSKSHYAVLTDYAWMEAYKGTEPNSISHSMKTLSKYPKQVIILKNTVNICGLNGRSSGLQKRLIDEYATKEFEKFCQNVHSLQKSGQLQSQVLEHQSAANEHMNLMLQGAEDAPSVFGEMANDYTAHELKIIRSGKPLTKPIAKKMMDHVMGLSFQNFSNHPKVQRFPTFSEVVNTFIFRASLSQYVLSLQWISEGTKTARPDKVRNSMIDALFAAYATYFDGLLTKDKECMKIYNSSKILIGYLKQPTQ